MWLMKKFCSWLWPVLRYMPESLLISETRKHEALTCRWWRSIGSWADPARRLPGTLAFDSPACQSHCVMALSVLQAKITVWVVEQSLHLPNFELMTERHKHRDSHAEGGPARRLLESVPFDSPACQAQQTHISCKGSRQLTHLKAQSQHVPRLQSCVSSEAVTGAAQHLLGTPLSGCPACQQNP